MRDLTKESYKFVSQQISLSPKGIAMFLVRAATIAFLLIAFSQNAASQKSREQSISTENGAVATDDGRCSDVRMNVLREGGNAVDASVAAAFCLGVVSPASSGIGGGAFILVKMDGEKKIAYDARETAPLLATKNMYDGNADLKKTGALSVGVPGELAGLYTAWRQHGKLPWERLVNPAEKLAAEGFEISKYLYMQMNATRDDILVDKGLSEVFVSNGELKKPGTIIRNPRLASTLKQIAENGPKAFYNGTIGVNLLRDILTSSELMTLQDLLSYKVNVEEPLSIQVLQDKVLISIQSSLTFTQMMVGMQVFNTLTTTFGNSSVDQIIEILRLAARRTIGIDLDFIKWIKIEQRGGSHISVIDSKRNAVSMTSSLNSYFGAKMMSSSTGIVLNNAMDYFSIPNVMPLVPSNFIRPRKRPLMSSMAPIIVLKDGKVKAVLGGSGGPDIVAAITEVFLNYFYFNMDPLSSVLAPRFYPQLKPNIVLYDNWTTLSNDHIELPKETRLDLEKKGHVLRPIAGGPIVQFIVQESDENSGGLSKLVAVSDPRKGGFPSGY